MILFEGVGVEAEPGGQGAVEQEGVKDNRQTERENHADPHAPPEREPSGQGCQEHGNDDKRHHQNVADDGGAEGYAAFLLETQAAIGAFRLKAEAPTPHFLRFRRVARVQPRPAATRTDAVQAPADDEPARRSGEGRASSIVSSVLVVWDHR